MHTIIIAAGTSQRLQPLTDAIPKTLLSLGSMPMLEYILKALTKNNLNDITIVTGHGHESMQKFVQEAESRIPALNIDLLFNPRYHETGNIVSVRIAEKLFSNDTLLIHSDCIFHADILPFLLQEPHPHAMIVDDHKTLGEEEMKVLINEEGNIIRLHKTLNPLASHGEYVGIAKFGNAMRDAFRESLDRVIAQNPTVYYEDALQDLIDRHAIPIRAVSSQGLPVMEVDTPEDLEAAKRMVAQWNEK